MMKYNKLKRAAAGFLAVLMVSFLVPLSLAADDSYEITEFLSEDSHYEPIPLLIVKINYDADGDGIDGYIRDADGAHERGEQWSHSSDSYWNKLCFSDEGRSLKNYYKLLTDGEFYFYPAEESYANAAAGGTVNDGIVTVTIPFAHPEKSMGNPSAEDTASRLAALGALDEYVDFASFDKNGDGKVDYTELAIVYVCGGYEVSSGYKGSAQNYFGVHGHYTTGSGKKMDGVTMHQSGFVRVGEYVSDNTCLAVGTLAHELGHYLGTYDLYDTNHNGNSIVWNYVSNLSLMSSGSHNSYSGDPHGTAPSYMDPYHLLMLGFVDATIATDGTYTVYSQQSTAGNYNIIKINTPNPDEYYLIENRYGTESKDSFDAIDSGARGIMIWHIDENAISRGRVNNEGSGHDPGVVVMGTRGLMIPYGFYYREGIAESYYTFNSENYKFPVSGTAYTSLTEEEAKSFHLKIDILSDAGNEMKIKITGAYDQVPAITVIASEKTSASLSFVGRITDLNGGSVTSCGFILSTIADYKNDPNAKIVYVKPDEYGKYTYLFEGLSDNTKYFCTAFAEGSNGRSEKTAYGYTKAISVPRDYYIVHLYRGQTAVERSFDVKLRPGEILPDRMTQSMKKTGYVFGGWYTDENYTTRFDLNSTQTEIEDITLFAKWIPEDRAAQLTLVGAESRYGLVIATEAGDTFAVPDIQARAGYTLVGWYTDAEFTIPYDFETRAEDTDGLTLYAKWEADEPDIPEDTTTEGTTAIETTSTTDETTAGIMPSDKNSSGTVLIIVIAAAAVIAVVAVIYIFYKKKQKTDKNGEE